MLSSVYRRFLLVASLLAVGCGGSGNTSTAGTMTTIAEITPSADVVAEGGSETDMLLEAMAQRYDELCAERKAAYSERDPELRRELLERNDVACRALDDSLKWVMSLKEMELTR